MNTLFYLYGAFIGFPIGVVVGLFLQKPRRHREGDGR